MCLAFLTFYPDISDLHKDVEFNGDPAVARVEAQAPQQKLKVSSLSAHVFSTTFLHVQLSICKIPLPLEITNTVLRCTVLAVTLKHSSFV